MDAFTAAFVVALSGLLALAIWKTGARLCRWIVRQLKAAYLAWFSEAVDEHVGPRFEQLRQETQAMANQTVRAARETAADVAARLEEHTQEEGEIVRVVVRDEIAPLVASVAKVQAEVQTVNGRTLAMLADAEEGRRIERDVPPSERTDADQRYVTRVEDDDHET